MSAPVSALASRLLALLATPVVAVKAAIAHRKIAGHLSGLDDHLLRDIGLTRADVDCAMSGSALDDPTLRLAAMAREARSSRRAAALEQLQWARMVGDTDSYAGAEIDRHAA